MATTSVSRRVVRIPNLSFGAAAQVRSELISKMNSLKLAGTSVFITYSDIDRSVGEPPTVQFEADLTPANDTTLVASFPAWAALLGLSLLDTEVSTWTAGH